MPHDKHVGVYHVAGQHRLDYCFVPLEAQLLVKNRFLNDLKVPALVGKFELLDHAGQLFIEADSRGDHLDVDFGVSIAGLLRKIVELLEQLVIEKDQTVSGQLELLHFIPILVLG